MEKWENYKLEVLQSDFKEMIAFPNVLLVAYLTSSGL